MVKRVYIPLPCFAARRKIIENLLAKERVHSLTSAQIDKVATLTEGTTEEGEEEKCLGSLSLCYFVKDIQLLTSLLCVKKRPSNLFAKLTFKMVKLILLHLSLFFCNSLFTLAISAVAIEDVRPISFKDFEVSLKQIRRSVSAESLQVFQQWNKEYGCANL